MKPKAPRLVIAPPAKAPSPKPRAEPPPPAQQLPLQPAAPSWRRIPVPRWVDAKGTPLGDLLRGAILKRCLWHGFAAVAPTLTFASLGELQAQGRTFAGRRSELHVFGVRGRNGKKGDDLHRCFGMSISEGSEYSSDVVNAAFTRPGALPAHLTPSRRFATCEPIPLASQCDGMPPMVLRPRWEVAPRAAPRLTAPLPSALAALLPPSPALMPCNEVSLWVHPNLAWVDRDRLACGDSVLVWQADVECSKVLALQAEEAVLHSSFASSFLRVLLGPGAAVPVSCTHFAGLATSYSAEWRGEGHFEVVTERFSTVAPFVDFPIPTTHTRDLAEAEQRRVASLRAYKPLLVHAGREQGAGLVKAANFSDLGLRLEQGGSFPLVGHPTSSSLFWLLSLAAHQRAERDVPGGEALAVAYLRWMAAEQLPVRAREVLGAAAAHRFLSAACGEWQAVRKAEVVVGGVQVRASTVRSQIRHDLPVSCEGPSGGFGVCRWRLSGTYVVEGRLVLVQLVPL